MFVDKFYLFTIARTQMTSSSTLNILFYFKNSSDAGLLENELANEKVAYNKYHFSELSKLKKELLKVNPDVIIAEYSDKPKKFELLETVKNIAPFIPVILFSENINHDEIIKLIKMGATDVISLDNLERLLLSVNLAKGIRNLRIEQYNTQQALEEN